VAQLRKWSAEANAAADAAGEVRKYIRHVKDKWKVYSEAGDVLGTHDSQEDARRQLAVVEFHKHNPAAKQAADEVQIEEAASVEKDEDFEAAVKTWSDEARAAAAAARASRSRGSAAERLGRVPAQSAQSIADERNVRTAHEDLRAAGWKHGGAGDIPSVGGVWTHPTHNGVIGVKPNGSWEHRALFSGGRVKVYGTGTGPSAMEGLKSHLGAVSKDATTAEAVVVKAEFPEISAAAAGHLRLAFDSYALGAGLVLKGDVEAEAVEAAPDLGAVIYRVGSGDRWSYFAAGDHNAVRLPSYRAISGDAFVPVRKSAEQRYSLGVVYPHGEADFHNETMTETELEKSAWSFMAKDGMHARVGLMHEPGTDGAGRVVESYIYRGPDWTAKAAADEAQVQTVKSGDWLMGVVWEPKAWELVQAGKVQGYSLQGAARKSGPGE
jgi:hypothetical protein